MNTDYWQEWPVARPEELTMAKNRNANRTMPAADPTGRRPPAQATPARARVPSQGTTRAVKLATRDPRRKRG